MRVNAIRVTAISFALLAGVTGIISGIGLMMQGHVAPETRWVSMIGPDYSNWEDSAYSVLTVIPSFYWTGTLALIVSIISTIWALRFLQTDIGSPVMLGLAIAQALVGGGWVLDLGIFTSLLAKGSNSSLYWWERRIPRKMRKILARMWIWSVGAYGLLSFFLLLFVVMGVNDAVILSNVDDIAILMMLPCLVMVFGAISHDIENSPRKKESLDHLTKDDQTKDNAPKPYKVHGEDG